MDTKDFIIILGEVILFFWMLGYGAYLKKRAEDYATKKEVGAITAEVEGVKAGFELTKIHFQTQFVKLHEKRFLVIENIFKRLARLQLALTNYEKVNPLDENAFKEATRKIRDSMDEQVDYFEVRRIFLDQKTQGLVRAVYVRIFNRMADYLKLARPQQGDILINKEDLAKLSQDISVAFEALETEFQRGLGFTAEKKNEPSLSH
jgi:hypothetical protein